MFEDWLRIVIYNKNIKKQIDSQIDGKLNWTFNMWGWVFLVDY